MAQLGFYFDSSACSGCKACQAACKDKNNLPTGTLWRRVYEVTGGGWTQRGLAWSSDVFAYNVSVACNHCHNPICVEVCPSSAMVKRIDGIVLVDRERCLGCRYCSWACPYDALQYDIAAGRIGKCNSCADNVDAGLPPACVAGCPLRAMDFGDIADLETKYGSGHHIYPLPDPDLTHPAVIIKPHREASRASTGSARVANREEVYFRRETMEAPLIVFTIFAQMAVGMFWALSAFNKSTSTAMISLALCFVMAFALAVSLFHLGTRASAWRALRNLRSSWLSREILFSILFMGILVLFTGLLWLEDTQAAILEAARWGAAISGLAFVYSMSKVYRLRTVPTWNTRATSVSFVTTTLILGTLGCATFTTFGPDLGQLQTQIRLLLAIAGLLLAAKILIVWVWKKTASTGPFLFRFQPVLLALSLAALAFALSDGSRLGAGTVIAFTLALGAESIGRYKFYQLRNAAWHGI